MNKQIIKDSLKQSGHYVDIFNGILYVSKSFQTNANYYGTTEYHKMNEILALRPDMKIELCAATRKKRLTYEMMEAFIRIMPDAEENYNEYCRVRKMSVAYKSAYKYVEEWFAKQFPYYGQFFVEENGEAKWNAVAAFEKAKEQAESRGRYRGDLETLYLFERDTDEPLIVPDEFLDIQLFEEDKRKLRFYFSIKDKKGHYLSYDKQWSRIEASGYDVEYGRINNRHYVVIRKP